MDSKILKTEKIEHTDALNFVQQIQTESIDCILTDPPYLYINHRLDKKFDEDLLFAEYFRVLKNNTFLAIFGRGESLFRWGYKLNNLGFKFKEEIVWNKRMVSSPLLPLHRTHELCIIFAKGAPKLNKVRIPYLEHKKTDIKSVLNDLKRLISGLRNTNDLQDIINYLGTKKVEYNQCLKSNTGFTISKNTKDANRSVKTLQKIIEGSVEKSIMEELREHYTSIHPTQKPVRLLERIINLITKENDLVLDTFLGSGSTAIACLNTKRYFLGCEIDDEYFNLASKRIEKKISEKSYEIFN